jgi:hypothetical protein
MKNYVVTILGCVVLALASFAVADSSTAWTRQPDGSYWRTCVASVL